MKLSFLLPFVGVRKMPVHRDGTPFDTGEADWFDEKAPFYLKVRVFEWLGFGFPLNNKAYIYDSKTDLPLGG